MKSDVKLKIGDYWNEIQLAFDTCIKSSKHCSIATIGKDGYPHITPIGFVFLLSPTKAIYFEKYSKAIDQNRHVSNKVCLSVVNTSTWFWFKSLWSAKFRSVPGIRLYGELGELRKATEYEIGLYLKKIKSTEKLKGNQMIWSGLDQVREIALADFKPVVYPKMMDDLWTNTA